MDVCIPLDIFAVGNKEGKVFVHSISSTCFEDDKFVVVEEMDDQEMPPAKSMKVADKAERVEPPSLKAKSQSHPSTRRQTPVPIILSDPKCISAVRQVSFSYDGKYVVYSCDNGMLLLWSIHSAPLHLRLRGANNHSK